MKRARPQGAVPPGSAQEAAAANVTFTDTALQDTIESLLDETPARLVEFDGQGTAKGLEAIGSAS